MPTPKILTDVADIPESLKITHGGEEFLYYDSGSHDPERLLISHFKDSQKDAELKVEKINAGEDISLKKRKLEHIHKRVEALVLNYDTGKTDIMNFLSGMAHNVAI